MRFFAFPPLDFISIQCYIIHMKIYAVIFDLDNTLYNYDAAHAAAFRALSAYAAPMLGIPPEQFDALHRQMMDQQIQRAGSVCAAVHNRLIRYQMMLEALGKPFYLAPRLLNQYWTVFLQNVAPEPGIHDCLVMLRQSGYRLGIGTNMTADYQYEKLMRLRLLNLFDFFVSSEEVNAEKPNIRLFAWCAQKAGFPPEQCAFVGDSIPHDILGAQNAGMFPIWYCPGGAESVPLAHKARVLRSFADLPALLHSL